MDKNNPLSIVRHFASEIKNGRTLPDIYRHAVSEIHELSDELGLVNSDQPPGEDGITGEAIDVIACMLDLIFVHNPEITDEEINSYLLKKCEKWSRRYKDSVDGDRTIS